MSMATKRTEAMSFTTFSGTSPTTKGSNDMNAAPNISSISERILQNMPPVEIFIGELGELEVSVSNPLLGFTTLDWQVTVAPALFDHDPDKPVWDVHVQLAGDGRDYSDFVMFYGLGPDLEQVISTLEYRAQVFERMFALWPELQDHRPDRLTNKESWVQWLRAVRLAERLNWDLHLRAPTCGSYVLPRGWIESDAERKASAVLAKFPDYEAMSAKRSAALLASSDAWWAE